MESWKWVDEGGYVVLPSSRPAALMAECGVVCQLPPPTLVIHHLRKPYLR